MLIPARVEPIQLLDRQTLCAELMKVLGSLPLVFPRLMTLAMKNPHYKTTLEATYSRKFACHAFMRLEEAFKNVSFDLRKSSIDGFKSFDELKAETEKLLNSGSADNERLVAEFNEVCEPIKSADNKKFEVMARVNPEGKIEIAFVDV